MAVKWPNRDYRQMMNDGEILVMIDLLYISLTQKCFIQMETVPFPIIPTFLITPT